MARAIQCCVKCGKLEDGFTGPADHYVCAECFFANKPSVPVETQVPPYQPTAAVPPFALPAKARAVDVADDVTRDEDKIWAVVVRDDIVAWCYGTKARAQAEAIAYALNRTYGAAPTEGGGQR